ncbi:T9SS type A sorting domain-containing protein [Algibacter sp. Ld11]|uniref:T9SS type A sorting domain-containing protein n=1 Tax=Algibacter sp. Ld11 TaxID=649150 RepID=UPI003869B82B
MELKITQLSCFKKSMLKRLSIIGSLLVVNLAFSQTTVVDFELPSEYQHLAWEGTAEVVANPNSSGINTSLNVGKYTTPSGKAWGNASVVIINTPLQYKDLGSLEFNVIVPSSVQMYAKLELDGVGGVAEAYATPTASVGWQVVTLNFSALAGVDVDTATYDKFTFFFNVNDNVGGEAWYFDNIVIQNTLGIDNIGLVNKGFNVYPNPVKDVLSVKVNSSLESHSKLSLYTVTGQLIKTSREESISMADLKSGIYLLSIEDQEGRKSTQKIIKQ